MPADLHLKPKQKSAGWEWIIKPSLKIFACKKTATTNIKERFQKKKSCLKRGVVSSGWSFIMGSTVTFFFLPDQSQWLRKRICCLYTDTSVLMLFLWGFQYCLIFNVVLHFVPVDSLLHGGDVAVYVFFEINQLSLHTPFYSVVSVSVFLALSTVFHSMNSPDDFLLSHAPLPVFFSALLVLSTIWKSPSALI